MRRLILLLFIVFLVSCQENKPKVPKGRFKGKPKSDSVQIKKDTLPSTATVDTIKLLPKVMYPQVSELILKKMLEQEIKNGNIPGKYFNESFYDLFDIYKTDPRLVKFLDETISNYIDYTVRKHHINFKNINDSTANIIIKLKK
jgi:hypothetical protein